MTVKIVILWVGKAEFTRIYTIFRHTQWMYHSKLVVQRY